MIFHPAIIALCIDSLLTCGIMIYASCFAFRILRKWNLLSGSELQVELEHRTYLISTIMSICLVFQVLSLFLFIHTTDNLCTLFPGAMCAAGTLHLNQLGYPVLVLKLLNAVFAGIWLIINFADNQGYDYPLIKVKYRLLLLITTLVIVESFLLGAYFLSLHPHVITSCCGSLFSSATTSGTSSFLARVSVVPLLSAMFGVVAVTVACGLYSLRNDGRWYPFTACCLVSFVLGVMTLVVAISVYTYALPAHHCPFCMLHREYAYIGYVYYVVLLGGGIAGLSVGALQPFCRIESMSSAVPILQRKLAITAMLFFIIFSVLAACQVFLSELHVL